MTVWSLLFDLISRITSRSGAATVKIWFPDSKSVYRRSPLTSSSLISREQRCIWILVFAFSGEHRPKTLGCKLGCCWQRFSGLENHLTPPDCEVWYAVMKQHRGPGQTYNPGTAKILFIWYTDGSYNHGNRRGWKSHKFFDVHSGLATHRRLQHAVG